MDATEGIADSAPTWETPATKPASPTGARLRGALAAALRSHITHFVLLGGLLFTLAPRPPSDRDVHLRSEQLRALYGAEARRQGGPVDAARRKAVDARAIEDEILYREAIRLGLDRDDGIVRQRLIQKVIFLAEDLGGAASRKTEPELRAFYEETRDRWRAPETFRFIHVFAGPGKAADLAALRPQVIEEGTGEEPPNLGEAFPLARTVTASRAAIAAEYGEGFMSGLAASGVGAWSDPLTSRYGVHLVKVIDHQEERQETFEEARGKLKLAYLVDRKDKALRAYLDDAFERYAIDIDGEPVLAFAPSGRISPERAPMGD